MRPFGNGQLAQADHRYNRLIVDLHHRRLAGGVQNVKRPVLFDIVITEDQPAADQQRQAAANHQLANPGRVMRRRAEQAAERETTLGQDRLEFAERLFRPLDERPEFVVVRPRWLLSKQEIGDIQRFLVSFRLLQAGREIVERPQSVAPASTWLHEEIEKPLGFLEIPFGDPPQGHADPGFGKLGVDLQGLEVKLDRIIKGQHLAKLGGHRHAEAGVVREQRQRRLAEIGGLLRLVKRQEQPVRLQRRIGRRLLAELLETGGRLGLLVLLVNVGLDHVMPAAGRASVENPLAAQRDDRDEDDDEPEPRIIRLEVAHPVARPASRRPERMVLLAVIMRADSIEGRGHRIRLQIEID